MYNQEIFKFNFSNFFCLFLSLEKSPINSLFLSNRKLKLVLIVFEKISNLI